MFWLSWLSVKKPFFPCMDLYLGKKKKKRRGGRGKEMFMTKLIASEYVALTQILHVLCEKSCIFLLLLILAAGT